MHNIFIYDFRDTLPIYDYLLYMYQHIICDSCLLDDIVFIAVLFSHFHCLYILFRFWCSTLWTKKFKSFSAAPNCIYLNMMRHHTCLTERKYQGRLGSTAIDSWRQANMHTRVRDSGVRVKTDRVPWWPSKVTFKWSPFLALAEKCPDRGKIGHIEIVVHRRNSTHSKKVGR